MRLSEFLRSHAQEVLAAWDQFASTLEYDGPPMDRKLLRDHAEQILSAIADDLEQPQTDDEQIAKSEGKLDSTPSDPDTPAETHANTRMESGVAVGAMITEYRALRASVLRLWDEARHDACSSADLRDITRFNEAIDQAITESVTRYTVQTKQSTDLFIGILGHDIRNPLGTISLSVEHLILSGQLSRKSAEKIQNSIERIKSVIEHVVDFSRVQLEGIMPVEPVQGNLADQFYKVVEETRVRHPGRTLRLETNGDFQGSWDEGRMGQLLSNLLGNAMSYGARDEAVSVRMWADARNVSFSVHNGGPPIPKGALTRIFLPLVRGHEVDSPERRQPEGLGLGLFICKEIVKAHGGTIEVDSQEGKGTVFTVQLPRIYSGLPAEVANG